MQEVHYRMGKTPAGKPVFEILVPSTFFHQELLPALSRKDLLHRIEMGFKREFGISSAFGLDGKKRFGFRRCGYYDGAHDYVLIKVQLLSRKWLKHVAQTLSVLFRLTYTPASENGLCFEFPFSNGPKGSNVYGDIRGDMLGWLKDNAGNTNITDRNVTAMCAVWDASAPNMIRRDTSGVWLHIHDDGRPGASVTGFGVTSGVLPHDADLYQWRFSSDNVDAAYQGLTILAGWFTLYKQFWTTQVFPSD